MSEPARTLHEAFFAVADRHPERVAIVDDEGVCSYGQLAARARGIAAALILQGVGPGERVAVLLPRRAALLATIVGVLSSGAAYVPLDVEHPVERLAWLIEDCGARVLLVASGVPAVPSGCAAIDPDRIDTSTEPVAVAVRSDAAAYVIYTSGSTGRPKGVVVEHQQVLALFDAARQRFDLPGHAVWSMTHSPAFDFSVWEMWGALLHGARLVMISAEDTRRPEALWERLRAERVAMLSQTPSAFRLLQQVEPHAAWLPALRTIVFGGERLDLERLRGWMERHGDEQPELVNMYGITETTVHVTHRRLRLADLARDDSPIGEPLPHLEIRLLDEQQQPVAEGEVGEIVVGGTGVARGYLDRPELTAARFVDGRGGSGRWYHSGDLARRTPDGYEYLGRADRQLKIRGHRIERGEIEAALERHAAVAEAVVLVEDGASGPSLHACLRLAAGARVPTDAELRAHAEHILPRFMVPTRFAVVAAIPLTTNGKVDEPALRTVAAASAAGETDTEAIVTPTARFVLETWRDELGLPVRSPDDDFFALGGHSLLFIELVAAIERRFELQLPFGELLSTSTPREQAALIERLCGAAACP